MNSDDLAHDKARQSQAEFKALRGELVSLRRRGLAKVSKQGTKYSALLAIARERGHTGLANTALQELLREAVKAMDRPEDYRNEIRAEYGIEGTYSKSYSIRRATARRISGGTTESAWAKYNEPEMANTLTEALLGLRGSKSDASPQAPVRNGTTQSLGICLAALHRPQPLLASLALCIVAAALILAGVFSSHSASNQPEIIDAANGRLLTGAAAVPHADRIGNSKHLVPNTTIVCVASYSSLSPGCTYQQATRDVCETSKSLTPKGSRIND